MLKKGKIIYDLKECRIFDFFELIQCIQCNGYGHFKIDCRFGEKCKFCAESHKSADCTDKTNFKCTNCLRSNAQGKSFNVNHIATYDKCPSRMERIYALKNNLISKNEIFLLKLSTMNQISLPSTLKTYQVQDPKFTSSTQNWH